MLLAVGLLALLMLTLGVVQTWWIGVLLLIVVLLGLVCGGVLLTDPPRSPRREEINGCR